jgi:prephenate dehydrogenase
MFQAPLVVGYKGEIGRFILGCLLEEMPKANDILCVDVNNSDADVIERLQKTDCIYLCVPLHKTAEWLRKYSASIGAKLVIEQSSVKGFLYQDPAFAGLKFLSMHLLFRPSATAVADRRALLFSDRLEPAAVNNFADYATRAFQTSIRVIESTGKTHEVHDEMMATQQALVHKVVLALADSLGDSSSQTYVGQRVCELAERINAGDQTMYRLIQENPFAEGKVAAFRKRLT